MRANEFIEAEATCSNPNCDHTVKLVLHVNHQGVIKTHDWQCGQCLYLMTIEVTPEVYHGYLEQTGKKASDDEECDGNR